MSTSDSGLGEPGPGPRRTRANALRNRDQILRAAAELILEQGPTVPMEMIARRAGIGIATLYRHFPDHAALLRQVALDALRQSAKRAWTALAEEPDAFTALARYMHDAVDLRTDAVMAVIVDRFPRDEALLEARRLAREAHNALIDTAHREGSLRPDVTAEDITLLITRLTSPMSGTISAEDNHRLGHRQLEVVLDGLISPTLWRESPPDQGISVEPIIQQRGDPGHADITSEVLARQTSDPFDRGTTLTATSSLSVSMYLSDEGPHATVESAVEEVLARAGLSVVERDDPILGSWFRRVRAGEVGAMAAHAADSRLVLAHDAHVTSTMLQHLGPVLTALQSTKDAVVRIGAVLIVKLDDQLVVHQLTAKQQLQLDHQPQLAMAPREILTALELEPGPIPGNGM